MAESVFAQSTRLQPVAWVDGNLQPFHTAALPLSDLGVVAGAAITELARTFGHQPFQLVEHLSRLRDACTELGFPQPFSTAILHDAALTVLNHNRQFIDPTSDLGIVIFTTAGVHATYLNGLSAAVGTTVIHTFELPFAMWRQSLDSGVRLRIPAIRQLPADCLPVHRKVRNRLHWWLAHQEAAQREPGSRALLLNHSDHITETSTSCFYAVMKGEILTPDTQVLDSMTRRVVEQLSNSLGLRFRRAPIHVRELKSIEEAFLSSTPVCLLPVSHIDGQPVGSGKPGPVFEQLSRAWNRLVGMDIAAQIRGTAGKPQS